MSLAGISATGLREKTGVIAIALAAALALSGCGDKDAAPELMNLRSKGTPDEFAIMPVRALEMPQSLADLPTPTPGGSNRTDRNPEADAIIALGGTPQALTGGVPSADAALFAQANRFGTETSIRSQLATEDLDWRRKNDGRLLERWFNKNIYFKAYRDMALNQQSELAYWRGRGIRTPSAPPPANGEN